MNISRRGGLAAMAGIFTMVVATGCADNRISSPEDEPPDTTTTPPPSSGLSLKLEWASYLGASNYEEAREPVVLAGNRILFSARVLSQNLPTTAGALQPSYGGGSSDTYLAIVSADGKQLEAATYFGGSGMERPAYGMALATNGDIVFTSGTDSRNLPTTPGAYLTQNVSPEYAGYVCRVAVSLTTIRWCTYINGFPRGGLTLSTADEVVVVGRVPNGSPFTGTTGAFQTAKRGEDDAFVIKLAADGSRTLWRTRIGGTSTELGEVALSATYVGSDLIISGISNSSDFPVTANAEQPHSTGPRDFFVARLSGDGSTMKYGTLLGGSDQDSPAHPDVLLPDGSVLVAGITQSPDVQATLGSWAGGADFLIAKFNPSRSAFDWVRYMGGSSDDRVIGRAVDRAGRIIIVGESSSDNFPVTPNALQTTRRGGRDGVIVVLDASGAVLYSTYFGGSGDEWIRGVATSDNGTLFVVGSTTSDDLPGVAGSFQSQRGGQEDAFVARLTLSTGN